MISTILVPLDGSSRAEQALGPALAIQQAFEGCEIALLTVVEPPPGPAQGLVQGVEMRLACMEANKYLERQADKLRSLEVPVRLAVAQGSPAVEILDAVRRTKANLLVLTTHGWGEAVEFSSGGTAQKVIEAAECSLLFVRTRVAEEAARRITASGLTKIMVPLDGSLRGDWALHLATSVARMNSAELILVHVVRPPPSLRDPGSTRTDLAERDWIRAEDTAAKQYLAEREWELEALDLTVRSRVAAASNVADALNAIALQEDVSLIVLAAHGESGPVCRPYGGVTQALLSHGATPILVFQDAPDQTRRARRWRSHAGGSLERRAPARA